MRFINFVVSGFSDGGSSSGSGTVDKRDILKDVSFNSAFSKMILKKADNSTLKRDISELTKDSEIEDSTISESEALSDWNE